MNSHQLINQTSGDVEYHTPKFIIEAARRAMDGGIDLDPASSMAANINVGALEFYTAADNGLTKPWSGRVWLNHPFGRHTNSLWIDKLMREFASGRVSQACCITYACTSESWFKPLLYFPQCFLLPRTNFLLPDGTVKRGVTKGSVVTYLGPNPSRFADEFHQKYGIVKTPYIDADIPFSPPTKSKTSADADCPLT